MKKRNACFSVLLTLALVFGLTFSLAPEAAALDLGSQVVTIDSDTIYQQSCTVTSDYTVVDGTVDLWRHDLTVNGDVRLDGGDLRVNGGTLTVQGDLYVAGNLFVMGGEVTVSGDVILAAGKIDLGMGKLDIGGDFHIAKPVPNDLGLELWNPSRGRLVMRCSPDTVIVGGDFYADATYGVDFKEGTLCVAGDFTQKQSIKMNSFTATGGSTVILNGTQPQTVTLECNKSNFATLNVLNESGIIVPGHFEVRNLTAKNQKVKIQSQGAVFRDVTLGAAQVTVEGDLTLKGDLRLGRNTLQVNGDLVHTQGEIKMEWGKLNIAGSYYSATPALTETGEAVWDSGYGKLSMIYPKATMTVEKDFYLNARNALNCSAGTIAIAGNLTQEVDHTSNRFYATYSHRVVFNGTEPQTVTFRTAQSTFALLDVQNPQGIVITDHLAAQAVLAGDVTIVSEGAALQSLTLRSARVRVVGDLVLDGELNLRDGEMVVEGNLTHTSGKLDTGRGTLTVQGDYTMALPENDTLTTGYGEITMKSYLARVNVEGDFYMDTIYGFYGQEGTLTVQGDLTQAGADRGSFLCVGTHKVALTGRDAQKILLENPESKFYRLILSKDLSSYTFQPRNCWKHLDQE